MIGRRARAGDIRILALGDSYTIGEGVAAADCWPLQLAGLLRERGVGVGHVNIIARTGWTTDELAAGIDAAHPPGPFDLVTLLIGVNDQYRGRPIEDYRLQLRGLVARAVTLAGGRPERVVMLSIPDWSVTPFAHARDRRRIAEEITEFNAVARREADASHLEFVDVTPTSRLARDRPELLVADGLHPAGAMYLEWAVLALPAALRALRQGTTSA